MNDFAEFERQVEELLTHLYDPGFHPPQALCLQLGLRAPQPLNRVRETLAQAIEQLQPATDVPASARVRRIYELLDLRYIQEKTQKETALRLGITVRHLRREQQLALHLLAEQLWEHPPVQPEAQAATLTRPARQQDAEVSWREQLRREIQALQSNAPGVPANLAESLATVMELAEALTAGVATVEWPDAPAAANLWVATHPSVLRELLISAVDRLAPLLHPAGILHFATHVRGESVEILLKGRPATPAKTPERDFIDTNFIDTSFIDTNFIDEALAIYGGTFALRQMHNGVEFSFTLPLVKPVTVLVVDDNDDAVHFYRRFSEGTPYIIQQAAHGKQLWEKLNALPAEGAPPPDVIILDIMLPDVGGWDLLRQLRKYPLTQAVPIIICSVIQHEELARTLGATLYLSKPVHRNEFLHALNVATHTASATASALSSKPNSTALRQQ